MTLQSSGRAQSVTALDAATFSCNLALRDLFKTQDLYGHRRSIFDLVWHSMCTYSMRCAMFPPALDEGKRETNPAVAE